MVLSIASHQGNAVKAQDATPHPLTWLKVTWRTQPRVSEMWPFWSCHTLPGGVGVGVKWQAHFGKQFTSSYKIICLAAV